MYSGKTVFSQIINYTPKRRFDNLVTKYKGNFRARKFSCWDQFLCMSFAQLTYRNSIRDIEACLKAQPKKLYHMGIKGNPSKSNISDANQNRDWRIYAEFAQIMIHQARMLYTDDCSFSDDIESTVYALDSTTIDLCLSLFPWAKFRSTKGAIKLHTLLDLQGSIPSYIKITDGSIHDVNILDDLVFDPGSFYIMDRAYIDFKRLYRVNKELSYFVIRAKSNFDYRRLHSSSVDKDSNIRSDQAVRLNGVNTKHDYPEKLRRVRFYDKNSDKYYIFLTNNFQIPAETVAALYKNRWKVELFFKWIKQHLRIKSFFGTSLNAVKTQIWIAVSIYVIIAIVKKQHQLKQSLYTMLQILSVSQFEKISLFDLLSEKKNIVAHESMSHQINMFDYLDENPL